MRINSSVAHNRRQHWVPQFYLRYFATAETRHSDNPQVWATPREADAGDVFRVGVGKIAAKAFLYSPLSDAGIRDDRVDRKLQELESLMAQIWPRIANEHYYMDDTFRKAMSLFLATLMLRHPATEEMNKVGHRHIVDLIDSGPKDAQGNPTKSSLMINGQKLEFDSSGWQEFRDSTENDHHRRFVDNIERLSMEMASLIMAKKPWWVCFSNDPVFATSDYPVACWNESNKVPGLGRQETEIYFPISPTRMLVIGNDAKPDNCAGELTPGGEGLFNQFVYRASRRWMFTCAEPASLFKNMLVHLEAVTGQISPEIAMQKVLRPKNC